jgi:hypothetical protein
MEYWNGAVPPVVVTVMVVVVVVVQDIGGAVTEICGS